MREEYNIENLNPRKNSYSGRLKSQEEEVDQAIYESEQEVANGAEPVDAETVFDELEKKYNLQ